MTYQITTTVHLKDGDEIEIVNESDYDWGNEIDIEKLEMRQQYIEFRNDKKEQFIFPKSEILYMLRTCNKVTEEKKNND